MARYSTYDSRGKTPGPSDSLNRSQCLKEVTTEFRTFVRFIGEISDTETRPGLPMEGGLGPKVGYEDWRLRRTDLSTRTNSSLGPSM